MSVTLSKLTKILLIFNVQSYNEVKVFGLKISDYERKYNQLHCNNFVPLMLQRWQFKHFGLFTLYKMAFTSIQSHYYFFDLCCKQVLYSKNKILIYQSHNMILPSINQSPTPRRLILYDNSRSRWSYENLC